MADPRRASRLAWTTTRLRRHWYWIRTQGIARVLEEDNLRPIRRMRLAVARWKWRRQSHDLAPVATAIFVGGLQRSGSNMLIRALQNFPELEIYNENSKSAFHRFELLPDETIRALVESSDHQFVVFKSLCDSHRVDDLLDKLGTPNAPRALWIYRSPDARARSAVAKFGNHNLKIMEELADGGGRTRWQGQRLSMESRELIKSFDYSNLTPESGAAIFWYVRNKLFFELGLHRREDIMLLSYDLLTSRPSQVMKAICSFISLEYRTESATGIEHRRSSQTPLDLPRTLRDRCDHLRRELDVLAESHLQRYLTPGA